MAVDLDDTTACPVGQRCENCGPTEDLGAVTGQCPVGVFCLTLCLACERLSPPDPSARWSGATRRVLTHCGHLGIDADQMADAVDDGGGS